MNRVFDILNNRNNFFQNDYFKHQQSIDRFLVGKSILILGASGSIGSSISKEILNYSPKKLILVDANENSLVELIRDIRSNDKKNKTVIQICVSDINSKDISYIFENDYIDHVFNFSALKHVRSEEHNLSLKRMIDTNVLSIEKLIKLAIKYRVKSFFSVSTDKAAYPANFMGVSKRIMENIMIQYSKKIHISSARFANVFMSDGSLFDGIKKRIEKNQIISGPSDIRRYFITSKEAAQISLLAICCSNNRDIFVPKMNKKDSVKISDLIISYLHFKKIKFIQNKKNISNSKNIFNLNLTKTDTFGEKSIESFYEKEEKTDKKKFNKIIVLKKDHNVSVNKLLKNLKKLKLSSKYKKQLLDLIKKNNTSFKYLYSKKSLNEKS